jgi:type I restriction enzyme S subunit
MDLKTFFDNFEIIANAPGGIARLREFILDLAISGMLVDRNEQDTPIDISWDLEQLKLDAQKIWGEKFLESSPKSWVTVPLALVGKWGSGGTPKRGNKEYYGGDIPWLVIGDLNDGLVLDAENFITKKGLAESSATIVPKGAVFVAMYGSIGKSGIAGIECATNQAIAHCIPNQNLISTEYLFQLVLGIRKRLFSQGKGLAQQNISQTVLKHLMVSLPPINEQKRIVAKVDELMALCDELENMLETKFQIENKILNHITVKSLA